MKARSRSNFAKNYKAFKMKEYRIRKRLRRLVYIVSLIGIMLYGGFAWAEIYEPTPQKGLVILFLLMIPILIILSIGVKNNKIIITKESIIYIGLITKKELKFNEIKGFNTQIIRQALIVIEYFTILSISGKKSIGISSFTENRNELISFLSSKVENLDIAAHNILQEKIETEHKEILKNDDFGFSIKEREDRLKKAHLTAKILNGLGIIVALWVFFFPRPYQYAIITCVSLPLITLLVIKYWKGLIRLDTEKGSAYPSAPVPIMLPGLILSLRAMLDFSIDDYSKLYVPVVVIAVIFTAVLAMIINKEKPNTKAKYFVTILSFLMLAFAYGYGAVVTSNCVFDESSPQKFSTTIVNKKKTESRKFDSYDLYLSPWGIKTEVQKVSIDEDLYNQLQDGDEVSVYIFKGKFEIPWVVVDYAR